jgi:hypothetical protein
VTEVNECRLGSKVWKEVKGGTAGGDGETRKQQGSCTSTGLNSQSFVASSQLSGSVPGFRGLARWLFWVSLALVGRWACRILVINNVAPENDWMASSSNHATQPKADKGLAGGTD